MATSDATVHNAVTGNHEGNQLKLLFDYTKFHIGLYTTLVTLLIAFIKLGPVEPDLLQQVSIAITVILFVLAGACGGIVASNIPHHNRLSEFLATPIGPRWMRFGQGRDSAGSERVSKFVGANWVSLEHAFFWLGIVSALIGAGFSLFDAGLPAMQSQPCNKIFLECRAS